MTWASSPALAEQVQVMRHGEIVEAGPVDEIFYAAAHDYTGKLLAAIPQLGRRRPAAARQRRHACWRWTICA